MEERLGEIVDSLFATAVALKIWHEEREEQSRRWQQAHRQREEAERCKKLEEARRKDLEEKAQTWVRAKDLREFIQACETQMKNANQNLSKDGREERWLAWAREHVARIDPIISGYLNAEVKRISDGMTDGV